MNPRSRFLLAAVLAASVSARADVCWHELKSDRHAEPAVSLSSPKCQETSNRLVFTRRSDGRIETLLSDSWPWFSSSQKSCLSAAKGLQFYMDAYPSTIRKLNETGDVSLPPGLVIRQTLGGSIGFTGVGPKAYEYSGACSSFHNLVQEYLDCRQDCKPLSGAAAEQTQCGSSTRRASCAKINGMESQDYLGFKEVDLGGFVKSLVVLGEAVEKNEKKPDAR